MKLKLLTAALMAAAMSTAAPAFAHGGHYRGHAYGHAKHWNNHHRHFHHHGYGYPFRDRVIVREYVSRVPAYHYYPAPAPGVHIVVPNIYIPWPR